MAEAKITAGDILDKIISTFPPPARALILTAILAAAVIFIVGFSRHGINFLKYGFSQIALDNSFEKRFDQMEAKFDTRFEHIDARLDGMDARFMALATNHFGHLKDFLTGLTSILLDKNIINNMEKARLDNHLRGM